jgi:hypothetical protein
MRVIALKSAGPASCVRFTQMTLTVSTLIAMTATQIHPTRRQANHAA